ncbi:MAG TPA: hypothetical protein VKK79_05410 [Candidatus Lokiarchaeia archaeon]|nr:hypothetical protein [Candidatus Lokiarchaeia archaeon]
MAQHFFMRGGTLSFSQNGNTLFAMVFGTPQEHDLSACLGLSKTSHGTRRGRISRWNCRRTSRRVPRMPSQLHLSQA